MTNFFIDYGLFLAETVTIVVGILVTVAGISALVTRSTPSSSKGHNEIRHLNDEYQQMTDTLQAAVLTRKAHKQAVKERKKQRKENTDRRRIFVLKFHGDIYGSAVTNLREAITAILTVANPKEDEVVLRLESSGGLVHAYGLAASQLQRIKDSKIKLTVAVDKIAASGGYMMACIADRIIAAPFAVLGSIGVVAQLPNFHRLLKRHEVDFEQFTAGEYKRTLSLFAENTDKGREKFQSEVEETHQLFKEFVLQNRSLDMAKVATGEHWYGTRALELQLVDELRTSDDYLLATSADADLFEVNYVSKKPLMNRLLGLSPTMLDKLFLRRDFKELIIPDGCRSNELYLATPPLECANPDHRD